MTTFIIFLFITLAAFLLFFFATNQSKVVLVFFLVWGIIVGLLALSGFYKNMEAILPRPLFIMIPIIVYVVYFYRELRIESSKFNYLLAIHGLRLPVELVLYSLFLQGKVPIVMTFEGWNYDILTGISAIILLSYILISKKQLPQRFFQVWNILGIIVLMIIVVTAILSIPLPIQQFGFSQPNVAVLHFPYAFLPAIVVPIVLLAHLLALKELHFKMTK